MKKRKTINFTQGKSIQWAGKGQEESWSMSRFLAHGKMSRQKPKYDRKRERDRERQKSSGSEREHRELVRYFFPLSCLCIWNGGSDYVKPPTTTLNVPLKRLSCLPRSCRRQLDSAPLRILVFSFPASCKQEILETSCALHRRLFLSLWTPKWDISIFNKGKWSIQEQGAGTSSAFWSEESEVMDPQTPWYSVTHLAAVLKINK